MSFTSESVQINPPMMHALARTTRAIPPDLLRLHKAQAKIITPEHVTIGPLALAKKSESAMKGRPRSSTRIRPVIAEEIRRTVPTERNLVNSPTDVKNPNGLARSYVCGR